MKTKTFKYSLTLTGAILCLSGCDLDRLDTPPLQITEDTFLERESQHREILYNAYAKMTDWYWFNNNDPKHAMYFLPGDDITEPNGRYEQWESFKNINATDGWVEAFWRSTFEMIQRANTVIEKTVEADKTIFDDPAFLDHHRGEALFLRALAYFKLHNMYGRAPLITERLNSENLHQPLSSGTQLLDQAITDLQSAIPLLPDFWPDSDKGRVSKSSAYGLLVKALVFRGDYAGNVADYNAAVQAFANVDASLVDNYAHNFSAYHENNEESLFEFQASNPPKDDNVWLQNDGPDWRGTEVMSTYWGFYKSEGGPPVNNRQGAQWRVTEKMFNAFGTDPRIAFFTEADRGFTKYGKTGLDANSAEGFQPGSMNNVRILRYPDVKLLAAEALLLSGGSTATAIEYINDIRERARNWAAAEGYEDLSMLADRSTTETDEATIMSWIEDERAIELLGEEQVRWFDLKRWDARGYIDLAAWTGSDEYFSTDLSGTFGFDYPKNLLLPIPHQEVLRNNAITENNPGF